MASELTYGFTAAYSKTGYGSLSKLVGSQAITISGGKTIESEQSIGTSEATVNKGDLSNIGWVIVENLAATNYLELFVTSSGTACARIAAGTTSPPIPVYCTTLYAKGNTVAQLCKFTLIEQ